MATLTQLYTAIEGMAVQYGGSAVSVSGLSDPRNKIESTDTPIRVLVPQDPTAESLNVSPVVVSGVLWQARWQIVDLLLVDPVTQRRGMGGEKASVITYIDDYVAALKALSLSVGSVVEGVRFGAGVIEYAGVDWIAVVTTLTIATNM